VDKERRQFERYEVFIPCTVKWGPNTIAGLITNMSLGGALITNMDSLPPPDGAMLALTFQVEKEEVKIVSSVTSRVVRTILEMLDDGDVGSIAVQFEDQSEEVQSQLQSVVHLISAS